MVEVLFGDSEAQAMKAAKNKLVAGMVNGPVSVWMAGKKAPPKKPFTGWIEGTSREVICLEFMMDVGNIREPTDSLYRKKLLCSMHRPDVPDDGKEMEDELKKIGDSNDKELLRLKEFLDQGESIRIWYSDAPYSRCGFYHLCQILEEHDNQIQAADLRAPGGGCAAAHESQAGAFGIHECMPPNRRRTFAVSLPEYTVYEKSVCVHGNWGNIAAEEFAGFLPRERELSKEEVHFYASLWRDLVSDNSPLRAVVNGRVIGVPEDFYDFQIWSKLTLTPVKEGRLIGDILGCFRVSVGDWWYARRIESYIRQGKIRIVKDSPDRYARMICLHA